MGWSRKSTYKFEKLSGLDEARDNVHVSYALAYEYGYSVVEIARIAGVKNARYIHRMLVSKKVIPQSKGGAAAADLIPEGMQDYLSSRNLTFRIWCAGWFMDPKVASTEIRSGRGEMIDAMRRDFPGYYKKLYGHTDIDFVHPPKHSSNRLNVHIYWDSEMSCYKAESVDVPKMVTYGSTAIMSLKMLQDLCRSLRTIQRLESMPRYGCQSNESTPSLSEPPPF